MSGSFSEGLRIQGRVLLALMLREARTRYGRTQLGYLWALVSPMIHIAFFWVMMAYMGRRANPMDDNNAMFLATGFLVFLGWRGVWSRTEGGYGSNEALLSFPIVKIVDVFLGRSLLELATWIAVITIIMGGLILTGNGDLPRNILVMIAAVGLLFALGFGLGMIVGIASEFVPSIDNLMKIPLRILYFASGLFFLPESLPPSAREIIAWNPVLHGITWFREGYYPMYESNILDIGYLFSWAVGSVLLALALERAARRRLRSIGM